MNADVRDYLLNSTPWTGLRTRLDLLNEPSDSLAVRSAHEEMLAHPQIKALIDELTHWPGAVVSSHKNAGLLLHKLAFLTDLGVKADDETMPAIIEKIVAHRAPDGPFQVLMNIPTVFGGTGKDQFAWVLCDTPTIVYSLAKLGLTANAFVINAKEHLTALGRDNGYPCAASKELGKFRGPGKKEDPCPYATLLMLKIMSLYQADRESDNACRAAESLLRLWENSQTAHPYMFYMGTDFRKLKAPFIWYDILHIADILSNFPSARADRRFKQMTELIALKADSNGLFTPESVWKAWAEWDFGQKKKPSPWLTFLVYRLLKRINEN